MILCCFLAPHVGVKPQDASARLRFCMATDLFFCWSLGVPYSNRVAVRLLYKGILDTPCSLVFALAPPVLEMALFCS